MANLETKYLGIDVKNPLLVGASSLTADMDSIKRLEDAGAGALVCKSLFEEQVKLEQYIHDEDLHMRDDWHAEMTSIFPDLKHSGPDEHFMWVRKTKEASGIPVIGSLNAVEKSTWVDLAGKMEETGVDGLELNFFSIPAGFERNAREIEDSQVEIVSEITKKVSIPVSVKLSPFYTSPLELVKRMAKAGASGFVLFNRLFHPSIDINKEEADYPFNLSSQNDHRMATRFVGLLHGRIDATICASNGIHTGIDAVETMLSGANAFQVVSTLYLHNISYIRDILSDIEQWMDRKGYSSVADFVGKMSAEKTGGQSTYDRAQYAKMLLNPEKYINRPKLI